MNVRTGIPAALFALLAALAAVASSPARGSNVTTVTLVARAAHAPALDAAIARFEQLYPTIAIKASYPAASATSSTIQNALAAGTADIMVLSTSGLGLANLPSLWAIGPRYLADLSARPWAKQLWKPLLPLASVAGKVYGEPLNTGSIQLVVYNKDL